jgi:putative spermidine/putrescine transport system ATP-binding protein
MNLAKTSEPSRPSDHPPLETSRAKVRIQGLTKRYGSVTALADTNLEVGEGEFLTLLGPSGSGKTTLLRVLAGLLDADEGDVWIGQTLITSLPPHMRDIGLVFQNYALFPHLDVFENIAFPLRMRGITRSEIAPRVQRALATVRMERMAPRMPTELSGGEQQRIALARAIVYEPSIILLDEPLAALDKKLREQLQLELKRVHRDLGITMLYVTHDQQEALLLSDRICLMNAGRIEQLGTPADLYFRPVSAFAADFIGESNQFDAVVIALGSPAELRGPCDTLLLTATTLELQRGQAVKIMIRPECLDILRPDKADHRSNAMVGIIEDRMFIGDGTKYVVRIGEALRLTVKALTRREQEGIAVGDRVALVCDPDNVVVLSI